MSEKEIKLILNTGSRYISNIEKGFILDYITNLQAIIKQRDKDIDTLLKTIKVDNSKITNLQEEVNKLTAESTEWENRTYCWQDHAEYLQFTIDKAIKYINHNKHLSMFADCREPEEDWNYDLEINPRELLNILKGSDK